MVRVKEALIQQFKDRHPYANLVKHIFVCIQEFRAKLVLILSEQLGFTIAAVAESKQDWHHSGISEERA